MNKTGDIARLKSSEGYRTFLSAPSVNLVWQASTEAKYSSLLVGDSLCPQQSGKWKHY
ncbi:hypothetical protein [Coleofasciculus sp. E1-EBD-02]|uniref:hypothetical protein n=1 Tax=Coleofasciculus sp. E1-EBD-02 TaxID=3068481 RepID=UPI0033032AC8